MASQQDMEAPRVQTVPTNASLGDSRRITGEHPDASVDHATVVHDETTLDLPEHLVEADRLLRSLATVTPVEPPDDLCERTMHRIRSGEPARRLGGGQSADAALTSLRRPL